MSIIFSDTVHKLQITKHQLQDTKQAKVISQRPEEQANNTTLQTETCTTVRTYTASHLQLVTIPDNFMKLLLTSNTGVSFLEGNKHEPCYCSHTGADIDGNYNNRNNYISLQVNISTPFFKFTLLNI